MMIAVLAMTAVFWPEVYSRIFTTFQYGDSALSERIFFKDLSYQIIGDNPSGVGIGNYSLHLREKFWGIRDNLYQPVHNIFLLYMAELGSVGGIVFITISAMLTFLGIKKVMKSKKPELLAILTAFIFILISGMFDHFYLTLQQGSLMFWIFAGMLYAQVQTKNNV